MKSRNLETEEYGYAGQESAKPPMRSDTDALGVLHRTAGSWLMLALAVTCTVTSVYDHRHLAGSERILDRRQP